MKTDKLGARSDKCIFIEYPKKTQGYYFYLADEQKVFVSLKTVFLEKKFFEEGINASKIELDEVQQIKPTQSSKPTEPDLIGSKFYNKNLMDWFSQWPDQILLKAAKAHFTLSLLILTQIKTLILRLSTHCSLAIKPLQL